MDKAREKRVHTTKNGQRDRRKHICTGRLGRADTVYRYLEGSIPGHTRRIRMFEGSYTWHTGVCRVWAIPDVRCTRVFRNEPYPTHPVYPGFRIPPTRNTRRTPWYLQLYYIKKIYTGYSRLHRRFPRISLLFLLRFLGGYTPLIHNFFPHTGQTRRFRVFRTSSTRHT